jgi:hypothetical protein
MNPLTTAYPDVFSFVFYYQGTYIARACPYREEDIPLHMSEHV